MASLRNIGIQPDALVLRTDRHLPEGIKGKVALMCDVDRDSRHRVTRMPSSIYEVPPILHRRGPGRLSRPATGPDLPRCRLDRVEQPARTRPRSQTPPRGGACRQVDLHDAYLSVSEAIRHGGFANHARVDIRWVASDICETPEGAQRALAGVDAIVVPGGFGVRGIEGKVGALRWAREHRVPTSVVPGAAVHGHRGRSQSPGPERGLVH